MIARLRPLLVLAALVVSACSATPQFNVRFDTIDGAAAYEEGRRQFYAGQFGLAARSFERAVEVAPNSVEALNGLGAAYDRIGRFDLARGHYERALRLEPASVQTLNNLGYSYFLEGRYDVAAAYLKDAEWHGRQQPQVVGNQQLVEEAARTTPVTPVAVAPSPDAPQAAAPVRRQREIVRVSRREQRLAKPAAVSDVIKDVLAAQDDNQLHGRDSRVTVQLPTESQATPRPGTNVAAIPRPAGNPIHLPSGSPKPAIVAPRTVGSPLDIPTPSSVTAALPESRPPALTMAGMADDARPSVSLAGDLRSVPGPRWPELSLAGVLRTPPTTGRIAPTRFWGGAAQVAARPGFAEHESYW